MPEKKPDWYDDIEKYIHASAWGSVYPAHMSLEGIRAENSADASAIRSDWGAARRRFDLGKATMPPIDWAKPPAESKGAGVVYQQLGKSEAALAEEAGEDVPLSGAPLLKALAEATGLNAETVGVLIKDKFGSTPEEFASSHNGNREAMAGAVNDAFEGNVGKSYIARWWSEGNIPAALTDREQAFFDTLKEMGGPEALAGAEGAEGWPGGYGLGEGGVGGVGGVGGMDYPPSGFYDLQKWMMGGPETLGEFWDYMDLPGEAYAGISRMASPLSYAQGDPYEFLARMTQPGQFYPGSMYTLAGKAGLPMGLSMPGEFYGMMEAAMPQGIAPGTPTPDFSFLEGLGQAPAPGIADFLMSLIQPQSPELPLAMIQALLSMQQESAMPFLQYLMSPGGMLGGGGDGGQTAAAVGGDDFLERMSMQSPDQVLRMLGVTV